MPPRDKNQYLFYYYDQGIGVDNYNVVTLFDLANIIADESTQNLIDAAADNSRKLPCYVTSGQVRFAVKGEGERIRHRAAVIFIDIDKTRDGVRLTPEQSADLVERIKKDCPYWVLIYRSKSVRGVHLLMRSARIPQSADEAKHAHIKATTWFEKTYPQYTVDKNTRTEPRIAYLSHDPDVDYRQPDEADIFQYATPPKPAAKKQGKPHVLDEVNSIFVKAALDGMQKIQPCLLYTSPSPRD